MAHLLAGDDDKNRDLTYDEAYRCYLITRTDPTSDYRFGRTQGKRVRARTALRRVNGYLQTMIEAIADSKLRRMQRELELRGIRYDRPNSSWKTLKPRPAERFGTLHAAKFIHHIRCCFPHAQRRQRRADLFGPILGRPNQEIPAGRSLHARSRPEMA